MKAIPIVLALAMLAGCASQAVVDGAENEI